LQTKLHIEYLACYEQNDIFNFYIYDLYIRKKLGKWSITAM